MFDRVLNTPLVGKYIISTLIPAIQWFYFKTNKSNHKNIQTAGSWSIMPNESWKICLEWIDFRVDKILFWTFWLVQEKWSTKTVFLKSVIRLDSTKLPFHKNQSTRIFLRPLFIHAKIYIRKGNQFKVNAYIK